MATNWKQNTADDPTDWTPQRGDDGWVRDGQPDGSLVLTEADCEYTVVLADNSIGERSFILGRAQRERMSSSRKPEELPEIGAVTPVLDPGLAVINNYCNISNCDTLVLSTALLPVYDFTSTWAVKNTSHSMLTVFLVHHVFLKLHVAHFKNFWN